MIKVAIILLKTRTLKNGSFPVVLRFTYKRQRKYFSTGFSIKDPKQWLPEAEKFKISKRKATDENILKNRKLETLKKKAETYIFNSLDDESIVFSNIVSYMSEKHRNNKFIECGRKYVERLYKLKKPGTAGRYDYVFTTFEKFLRFKDVIFERINESMIHRYVEYSSAHGLSKNTIYHNVKLLKAYYRKAISENLVEEKYFPFKNIKLQEVKTQPRAISREDLAKIRDVNLTDKPHLEFARDIFMFSFYTRGMSFVDIAYMKVGDIINNRYHYSRAKTDKLYSIKLVDEAMNIILKYNDLETNNSFVFPLIKDPNKDEYTQYQRAYNNINRNVRELGKFLDLPTKLTTYVSRHTWATLAKKSGISTSIISAGLGHSTERVTQVYLDRFENETIDEANDIITNF